MKVILVGQAPSESSDPKVPLSGRSGERLAALAGVPFEKLGDVFDRINVFDEFPGSAGSKGDKFPMKAARERAKQIETLFKGRKVVYLGKKVARAFGHPDAKPLNWYAGETYDYAIVPHTSGVNLFWNDPANRAEGCRFVGALAREATAP